MKKLLHKILKSDDHVIRSLFNFVQFIFTKPGMRYLISILKKNTGKNPAISKNGNDYHHFIETRSDLQKKGYDAIINTLPYQPKISIIITEWHNDQYGKILESITNQWYTNYELLNSTSPLSLNEIAQRVTGSHMLFIDNNYVLSPDCIFRFVEQLNKHPDTTIAYADEDVISSDGRYSNPDFKPAWSPHALLSGNYIGNNIMVSTDHLRALNIPANNSVDAELYDLLLRSAEIDNIVIQHIPLVLFHKISGNDEDNEVVTQSYKIVLERALERRNTPATVSLIPGLQQKFTINYKLSNFPKVSIIVPTKDQADLLKTLIDSIIEKTVYPDYEILVINNNSTSTRFFELVTIYEQIEKLSFKCITADFPFNFSRLINLGVKNSMGEFILMLNNDMEIITPDWLNKMVAFAQQENTGAIGARLLYPDNTLQHAGIAIGGDMLTEHVFINAAPGDMSYDKYTQTIKNYSAVTGACLMCRKVLYSEVVGMDEELPVEYNDIDLCLKMLQKGYFNVYLPDVILYHYESATRGHPFRSKKAYNQHVHDLKIFKEKWDKVYPKDIFFNRDINKWLIPGGVFIDNL